MFTVFGFKPSLFHEWAHHVDHLWSRGDHAVLFSFRWSSEFYAVHHRQPVGGPLVSSWASGGEIASELDAAIVAPEWRRVTAELFADLFEDWMRNDKRVAWDNCDPAAWHDLGNAVQLELAEGVSPAAVRARTHALFERGLLDPVDLPSGRSDLLGGAHRDNA